MHRQTGDGGGDGRTVAWSGDWGGREDDGQRQNLRFPILGEENKIVLDWPLHAYYMEYLFAQFPA
jgi:hypothetical protein